MSTDQSSTASPAAGLRLSPGQLAAWQSRDRFAVADPYLEISTFELASGADLRVLAASFCELVATNPVLQIVMPSDSIGPRQHFVLADPENLVVVHSVVHLPHSERAAAAAALIDDFCDTPLDLATGPLAQMCLVDQGRGHVSGAARASRLLLNRPRWFLLWRELRTIYLDLLGRDDPLFGIAAAADPEPGLAAGIDARWQEFLRRAPAATAFWNTRLPAELPALALPMRNPGASARYSAMRGDYASIDLSSAAVAQLRSAAIELGVEVPSMLQAALAALLHRYGDNELVPIATYFNQDHITLADTALERVNLLPVLVQVDRAATFRSLVGQVVADIEEVQQWRDVPLVLLDLPHRVSVEDGVDPAFQAGFRYWDVGTGVETQVGRPDDIIRSFSTARRFRPGTDLELTATDFGDRLSIGIHYCTDLFDPRVIDDMCGHLRRLLLAFVADPDVAIGEPPMLGTQERHRLLHGWNETSVPYSDSSTITDLLNESFARNPDRIALKFAGTAVTYAELAARSARLAHTLHEQGVQVGDRVALILERSPRMIEAIVATLLVGAAYVPMETDLPPQRAADLVSISGAVCAIVDAASAGLVPVGLPVIVAAEVDEVPDIDAVVPELPDVEFTPDALAYVLFTSGSTGRPKAAQVRHSGVVNLIQWISSANGIDESDNVILKSPYAHDISVPEMFLPLFTGGTIVIAEPDGHRDPQYLVELVKAEQVSVIHFVPTMLAEFVRAAEVARPVGLKHIFVGGEGLTKELATAVLSFPGWALHNLYGTTEASDYSTAWTVQLDDPSAICPIGRPIHNVRIYILGPDDEPRPVGVPGELCVGGVSVGAGYLGSPEATAKSFVPNPFEPGSVMYRSGDICRYRPDGIIEYVRRGDGEVKIHGHRIDLNEIETRVAENPYVNLAAILVREDTPGLRRLVAYAETDGGVDAAGLRTWCQATLAEYMVPSVFVLLPVLPHTLSGKIDRGRLPAPAEPAAIVQSELRLPSTPTEALVADVWSEVLALAAVGVDQDFYDLGGDSILAIRIATALRGHGFQLTVRTVFANPTIASLAGALSTTESTPLATADQGKWDSRVAAAVAASAPKYETRVRRVNPVRPTILVTGATGFLGRNLVAGLLTSTEAKVVCLARGSSTASATAEVADVRRRVLGAVGSALPEWDSEQLGEVAESRLRVVAADLLAPALGVDARGWHELTERVDSIVHVGAWVHHLHAYHRLAPANVGSASELMRLAAEAGGVPMRFVSTLSTVLYDGGSRVSEQESAPPLDSGGYVESKWVAEQATRQLQAAGLPVQIVRPPWLFASSINGSFNPDDALTRLILGCVSIGAIPDTLGIEPLLCINHAVQALIQDDLFSDPASATTNLPFRNVKVADLFGVIASGGIHLETLPTQRWREQIAADPGNLAEAILSDFGLAVGEDPTAASRPCPPVTPTLGSPQSAAEVAQATERMIRVAMR